MTFDVGARREPVPRCHVHDSSSSLGAQGDHRIDPGGARGGQQTRDDGNHEQRDRSRHESQRIVRRDAEQ